MAKNGKNKKRCERYRLSGHREQNKHLKQERHKKRMERFAKRRGEGKNYEYKPIPYEKGTMEYNREVRERAAKNVDRRTDFQKKTSIMRKLQNELDKKKAAMKAREKSPNKRVA